METNDPPYRIIPARTETHISAAKTPFTAYTKWLSIDLTFQGFAAELASLPGQYGSLHGELLLAYSTKSGNSIRCVAVRPLTPKLGAVPAPSPDRKSTCCEMKQLHVLLEVRSMGLDRSLVDAIVQRARSWGTRR